MSSLPITLFVPGICAPQGSKRGFARGNRVTLVESSPLVKPWRATIAAACHEAGIAGLRLDMPLYVSLRFAITRPKSHYRKDGTLKSSAPAFPTVKPDSDKLARAVHDALATDAAVIFDDSRIVTSKQHKHYADFPGVCIYIAEVKA